MKTRESGMPDEMTWSGFFEPNNALQTLGLSANTRMAVEFGSGYGTFSLAAASMIRGNVLGLDIDADLIAMCRSKAREMDLSNAVFEMRDFIVQGTGLEDGTADYVMLFNILHTEEPMILLHEARRILSPAGILAVMHWNYNPQTPRGPSMEIRPRPEDCRRWVRDAGFSLASPVVDLPPWHYGFTATI